MLPVARNLKNRAPVEARAQFCKTVSFALDVKKHRTYVKISMNFEVETTLKTIPKMFQ